jgi:hypothetical protein
MLGQRVGGGRAPRLGDDDVGIRALLKPAGSLAVQEGDFPETQEYWMTLGLTDLMEEVVEVW